MKGRGENEEDKITEIMISWKIELGNMMKELREELKDDYNRDSSCEVGKGMREQERIWRDEMEEMRVRCRKQEEE